MIVRLQGLVECTLCLHVGTSADRGPHDLEAAMWALALLHHCQSLILDARRLPMDPVPLSILVRMVHERTFLGRTTTLELNGTDAVPVSKYMFNIMLALPKVTVTIFPFPDE